MNKSNGFITLAKVNPLLYVQTLRKSFEAKKGVDISMRHKLKKEALEVIVQKIANDVDGKYLTDLLKIAQTVQGEGTLQDRLNSSECQQILKEITWLYGYENEILETLDSIKSQLEKKIFNKEASHVTIMSCMAFYCVLLSIFDGEFDDSSWYEVFKESENKRLIDCMETLQRYCPEKIEVEGFCEARRYIRLWDSAFNW